MANETIAEYSARIEKSLSKSKADKIKKSLEGKDPSTEIIHKIFPSAVIKSEDGKPATLDIISTKDVDRDNEVLLPQGCDLSAYDKTPTVLFGHDYGGVPVGVSKWRKATEDNIMSRTEYYQNQLARDVFEAREALGNSVGFIPLKWVAIPELGGDEDEYYKVLDENGIHGRPDKIFVDWELLEYSKVPVAANPSAVTLALKSVKSDQMKEELEKILDERRTGATGDESGEKQEAPGEKEPEEAPEPQIPCGVESNAPCETEPAKADKSDINEIIEKGKEDVLQALDSLRQAVEAWGEEKPPEGEAGPAAGDSTPEDDKEEPGNADEPDGEGAQAEENELESLLAEAGEEDPQISDEDAEKIFQRVESLIDDKIKRLLGKV